MRPAAPSLTSECEGLLRALEAAAAGESGPLGAWVTRGWPALIAALRRQGLPPEDAEDVAQEVVKRAWAAVRAGKGVRVELPWIARVTRNVTANLVQATARRIRAEAGLASRSAGDVTPQSGECLEQVDELGVRRRWLLDAVDDLPQPFRTAAYMRYLALRERKEVVLALVRWSDGLGKSIGPDHARYVLRETSRMLRARLAGLDPREVWAGRFRRKNRWNVTPAPSPHGESLETGACQEQTRILRPAE